jgi:hypothetical protein
MSSRLNITISKQIEEKLEKTKEKTGLNKSEIARRGIFSEIKKLKGDEN